MSSRDDYQCDHPNSPDKLVNRLDVCLSAQVSHPDFHISGQLVTITLHAKCMLKVAVKLAYDYGWIKDLDVHTKYTKHN